MHLAQQQPLSQVHPESDVSPVTFDACSSSHSIEGCSPSLSCEPNEPTGYSASVNNSVEDSPLVAVGDDAFENQPANLLGYLAKVRTHPYMCQYSIGREVSGVIYTIVT